jgi:hypothetical protein
LAADKASNRLEAAGKFPKPASPSKAALVAQTRADAAPLISPNRPQTDKMGEEKREFSTVFHGDV